VPELPETETIARDLDGALQGAVVRSVQVLRADVLRDPAFGGRALRGARGARVARALAEELQGAAVQQVRRRAKSVVLELGAAGRLVVTPRFTGALLLRGPDAPPEPRGYDCLRVALADGRVLTYRDVRRLGTVARLSDADFAAWDASLGPEPLDPALTVERFSGILRGSSRAVKSILMDQRRLAGVGNIYANEACWMAGVRPAARGRTITRERGAQLLRELRAVLTASIARRGTTFRDYQDAFGGRGGFAAELKVYGRGGLPCARCGSPLRESHAIDGRATVWCATCQR
jgi:formamidopyrimidine-DNA glycosylase